MKCHFRKRVAFFYTCAMANSRIEVSAYAKKILARGDGYQAVHRYLQRMEVTPADEKYILEELRLWENNNPPEVKVTKKSKFDFGLIIGVLFVAGGLLIARMLWDMGYIGTLPFILVAAGVTAIFKSLYSTNQKN